MIAPGSFSSLASSCRRLLFSRVQCIITHAEPVLLHLLLLAGLKHVTGTVTVYRGTTAWACAPNGGSALPAHMQIEHHLFSLSPATVPFLTTFAIVVPIIPAGRFLKSGEEAII